MQVSSRTRPFDGVGAFEQARAGGGLITCALIPPRIDCSSASDLLATCEQTPRDTTTAAAAAAADRRATGHTGSSGSLKHHAAGPQGRRTCMDACMLSGEQSSTCRRKDFVGYSSSHRSPPPCTIKAVNMQAHLDREVQRGCHDLCRQPGRAVSQTGQWGKV